MNLSSLRKGFNIELSRGVEWASESGRGRHGLGLLGRLVCLLSRSKGRFIVPV